MTGGCPSQSCRSRRQERRWVGVILQGAASVATGDKADHFIPMITDRGLGNGLAALKLDHVEVSRAIDFLEMVFTHQRRPPVNLHACTHTHVCTAHTSTHTFKLSQKGAKVVKSSNTELNRDRTDSSYPL